MRCRYCRAPLPSGFHCPRCGGIHDALWDQILDRRSIYRETNIKVLEAKHPHLTQNYHEVMSYNHHSDRGLVLWGDSGTGKTRICWLLLKRLHDAGVTVGAISAPALGEGLATAAWEREMVEWIDQLVACQVLLIDDLDKLPTGSDGRSAPRIQQGLYSVIEQITSLSGRLIITTNVTGDNFRARFDPSVGPAIGRRIRQFCRPLGFPEKAKS